jgi:hypothetical protein
MSAYVHTYIHTYIQTHMHTHIHIYYYIYYYSASNSHAVTFGSNLADTILFQLEELGLSDRNVRRIDRVRQSGNFVYLQYLTLLEMLAECYHRTTITNILLYNKRTMLPAPRHCDYCKLHVYRYQSIPPPPPYPHHNSHSALSKYSGSFCRTLYLNSVNIVLKRCK